MSHFLQISQGSSQNSTEIGKGEMKLLTLQFSKAISQLWVCACGGFHLAREGGRA